MFWWGYMLFSVYKAKYVLQVANEPFIFFYYISKAIKVLQRSLFHVHKFVLRWHLACIGHKFVHHTQITF